MERETHRYDDIIQLPRHISVTRPRMPMHDRASQFSSFAALVGFDSMIEETARYTDEKIELDETAIEMINEKLLMIEEDIRCHPTVRIVYFQPDPYKDGGAYLCCRGQVKKIDRFRQILVFCDGTQIDMEAICSIDVGSCRCDD